MATLTPNYSLSLPLVNDPTDEDLWGNELNADTTSIDTLLRQGICNTVAASQTTGFVAVSTIRLRNFYPCDATIAPFAATLPTALAAGNGATIVFKKTDASTNAITITRASSDTIDGATTQAISTQYDCYVLVSDGVSVWNILSEPAMTIPDASTTVKGIIEIATNAEVEAATDTTRAVVPSAMNSHPGMVKAWVTFAGSNGAIAASHNVGSVTRNGTGDYTVTFTIPFSSANYCAHVTPSRDIVLGGTAGMMGNTGTQLAGSSQIFTNNSNGSGSWIAIDAVKVCTSFYGDQ